MKGEPQKISSEPLTIPASALALGVSEHTIRAWLLRRRLGHLKLGRSVRIPRAEIDRLLQENFIPALPEPHAIARRSANLAAATTGAARKKSATVSD